MNISFRYNLLLTVVLSFLVSGAVAQSDTQPKKFRVTGAARGLLFGDDLNQAGAPADTVTAPKLASGHTLVDLGVAIRPNQSMEVLGLLRIRNDFGGFWGAGTTFDLRQLYVRGVVNNKVRYQLGDIDYKLTPYTLFNVDQETSFARPQAFQNYMDVVNYDNFYDFSNAWRQQGAAVDFGFVFRKFVREVNFNFFTSRINRTNFTSVSERLFSGMRMEVVQSDLVSFAATYVNMYDWMGTSRSTVHFSNPVVTGQINLTLPEQENWQFMATSEFGMSQQFYRGTEADPDMKGAFGDLKISAELKPRNLVATLNLHSVEADFRSPGAQTKRINFNAAPRAFQRITNEQSIRTFTLLDLLRETDLYNMQLSEELMAFDPRYDNITPYGDATPNRSGFALTIDHAPAEERYAVQATWLNFNELRGQGTTQLKNFQRFELLGNVNIHQWLPNYKKAIRLEAGLRQDQTKRDSEEGVRAVDLASTLVSTGFAVEFAKNLSFTGALQGIYYQGFDFLPLRSDFDQVVFFNEFEVDGSEQMIGLGLRYDFSENDYLTIQWNNFKSENNFGDLPNYEINQLVFLFSMKF
jgi:hypothetical protein